MPIFFIKTLKGLEKVAASAIQEITPSAKCIPRPRGYKGIVLVETEEDVLSKLKEIPEVEKVFEVLAVSPAVLNDIAENAAEIAKERIDQDESFAVRTTRRGSHSYTSLDVNVAAGAAVQKATGAPVNLTYPDKIVLVEIIDEKAYIGIIDGKEELKKKYPGKPEVLSLLRKISIAQIPYTGPLSAAKNLGLRIGRAVQTFEIREYVVAPIKPVEVEELSAFLSGLLEGVKSRLEIQRKSYAREVRAVPLKLQDMYQFVRDRKGEPIIATSTRGKVITEVEDWLYEIIAKSKRVNVLVGAREGIPTGILRQASLIIDVAPGVTLSTDTALPAIVSAIILTVLRKITSSKE